MKKHFINVLVAVGLLATLSSCSKEEQVDLKPVKSMAHPLDPGNFGYYEVVTGENYHYNDSISTFGRATENYLKLKPLSMEKYKNGSLLDSVCNQDLALYFESKALKTHEKTALWAVVPRVTDSHPPIVSVNSSDHIFIIKMSKMVTGFGLEVYSPYKGTKLGVNVSFWNSKLNKRVPEAGGTRYLNGSGGGFDILFGNPGGVHIWGVDATKTNEFDEVRITFEPTWSLAPPPVGPFEISFAGFRYKLAK
jgi:hypothetical protein